MPPNRQISLPIQDVVSEPNIGGDYDCDIESKLQSVVMGEEQPLPIIEENQTSRPWTTDNVWDVLTCKFVIGQLLFNIIASLVGPLGTFYLLFGYLSEGPYEWSSGPLVGVVVGSLLGSPLLIFALMPVGIPEAVENRWLPILSLDHHDILHSEEHPNSWISNLLQRIWKFHWPARRNFTIGILIGVVYVPVALLIARFGFGPSMSTWTLIWFNVVYEALLCIPVVLLGLVGYAVDTNMETTLELMSTHPNVPIRLFSRCWVSLKLSFCDLRKATPP